jgi:hypothetical protein
MKYLLLSKRANEPDQILCMVTWRLMKFACKITYAFTCIILLVPTRSSAAILYKIIYLLLLRLLIISY